MTQDDGWVVPQTRITYSRSRQEWLAIIFLPVDDSVVLRVLTIGCELSKKAAQRWASDSVQLMQRERRYDVEVPDLYERRSMQ